MMSSQFIVSRADAGCKRKRNFLRVVGIKPREGKEAEHFPRSSSFIDDTFSAGFVMAALHDDGLVMA